MKKLTVIILGIGLLFIFGSCEKQDIKPLPEYVAIQPASWVFGTITVAEPTFTFEFKLTTFEPQNYVISTVQKNAEGFVTGQTDIQTVDISGEQPNATITGTLNKDDVFTSNEIGATATLRLTLTSKQGNTNVAIPWQDVSITE